MKFNSPILVGLFMAAVAVAPAFAELPTRGELLTKRYEEDRTKGLLALNRRYIEAFQKELDIALKAKRLEEANVIQRRIKSIAAEIAKLQEELGGEVAAAPSKTGDESLLVGKTIGFAFDSDPTKTFYFSFQKDGKALWLGMKNQAIRRIYKPTGEPRQFSVWWPGHTGHFLITVGPDGKTAELIQNPAGKTVTGFIEKTD